MFMFIQCFALFQYQTNFRIPKFQIFLLSTYMHSTAFKIFTIQQQIVPIFVKSKKFFSKYTKKFLVINNYFKQMTTKKRNFAIFQHENNQNDDDEIDTKRKKN